jgi:hypothetical protein
MLDSIKNKLNAIGACKDAKEWFDDVSDAKIETLWEMCDACWLMWLIVRIQYKPLEVTCFLDDLGSKLLDSGFHYDLEDFNVVYDMARDKTLSKYQRLDFIQNAAIQSNDMIACYFDEDVQADIGDDIRAQFDLDEVCETLLTCEL